MPNQKQKRNHPKKTQETDIDAEIQSMAYPGIP